MLKYCLAFLFSMVLAVPASAQYTPATRLGGSTSFAKTLQFKEADVRAALDLAGVGQLTDEVVAVLNSGGQTLSEVVQFGSQVRLR